ncbi:hypothetical protein VTN00DRAFT_1151 [Thermoascus crustaceus]|uniref:uncharacterized protein n=1 Tax=Thermoascus crustaceus TaxID=5088 RepID=UPI003742EBDF
MATNTIPLWDVLKEAFGDNMDIGEGYSKCFAYFYRMALQLHAVDIAPSPKDDEGTTAAATKFDENDPRQRKFRTILTQTQERSFWILWRWWEACRAECAIKKDKDGRIVQPVEAEIDSDPEDQYYPNMREVHEKVHTVAGTQYQLEFQSLYNTVMANLFHSEFGNYVNPRSAEVLRDLRAQCAQESACLHVALECHYARTEDAEADVPVLRELEYVDNHLAHRSKQHTRLASNGGRRILHQDDLPGLDPFCATGSSVESCPWLEDISGLPYYLWDRVRRETIEVHTLTSTPSYTAISHTWGRWQKSTPPVAVPGVQAWLVPENSLFEVKELPEILDQVPTDTRYVWFDLVCIPQDRSPRARDEIARQAAIFKSARHAIAWWNGTPSLALWKGMKSTIQWMSQLYLDWAFSNDRPVFALDYPDVDSPATGMFAEYEYSENIQRESMVVLSWFSSLWTLQEVCLRPDIWLCNREWVLLTVGNGTPVALNTIVALTHRARDLVHDDYGDRSIPAEKLFATLVGSGRYHRGFLELMELFNRTGMDDLHRIEREHILLLATSRYCKRSRAEAIMSVLGMKEWINFSPRSAGDEELLQLVFGQFPLVFVREVAMRLGSHFFTSLLTYPPVSDPDRPRGTMLPFRANMNEQKSLHISTLSLTDHPSIASWVVQRDGTVRLGEVEILFSSDSDPANFRQMKCLFKLGQKVSRAVVERYQLQLQTTSFVGDLRFWVRERLPQLYQQGQYYAIKLRYRPGQCDGLLLKEVEGRPGVLLKIGNFYMLTMHGAEYVPKAPVQRVNWLVL